MMNARKALREAARKVGCCSLTLAATLGLAVLLCVPGLAQSSRSAPPAASSGPRALAVLELAPDGRARLVPIAIRIDNKFYDAGLYRAMPRPLAVDPQTVYEVQRSGAPLGLFTVTQAQTIKDVWIGLGQWRPVTLQMASKKPALPASRMQAGPPEVDDRPVLKRPGGETTTTAQNGPEPSPQSKPASVDDSRPTLKRPSDHDSTATADESRPTLKRPTDTSASAPNADDAARPSMRRPADASTSASKSDDDADRPTLKDPTDKTASVPKPDDDSARPAMKRPAQATPRPVSTSLEDVDRPTLRRGKPATRQGQDETAPLLATSPGAAPVGATAMAGGARVEVLPAISDAKGKESDSLLMRMNPTERSLLEGKVQAVAYAAIQKWVTAHPQTRAAAAEQMHVTAFQVFNFNNDAVAVYTAELPSASSAAPSRRPPSTAITLPPADPNFEFFVTVVTRTNMYGELHALLTQVTDSRHLDAYKRLDLIDGVDAEGTGMAQLLFRRVSDRGFSYGLYRLGMDRCWPIFESAEKDL